MAIEFSDANLGRVTFLREAEFGVEPNPYENAQVTRLTSSALAATKETAISDELRSDRMVGDLVETGFATGGDLAFELSLGGTWEDFLESLLAGTYESFSGSAAGNFTIAAATQTLSDADLGGTLFADMKPGQYIYAKGFANAGNNGWHRVASVTDADNIVLATDVADLTDETTAGGATYVGSKLLRNPGDPANIVKRSYALSQWFSDIDIAQLFLGQRLGVMSLSTAANAIVTGSWTFQGTSVAAQESLGDYPASVLPPTNTDVVGATANVGSIESGGEVVACSVQGVDLSVDNNLRNQNAVGSKYPCGIGYGRQLITGSVSVYFHDLVNYTTFISHTDMSVGWGYEDNAGNALHIYLPRVKVASNDPALEGIDTDVIENMEFQAIAFDPGDGQDQYQIQISIANASGA